MEKLKIFNNNYISLSTIEDAGFGVFANQDYKQGDLLEVNRFLKYDENYTGLQNYAFKNELYKGTEEEKIKRVIILGNGSIMNHSDKNNIDVAIDYDLCFAEFYANRDIAKDEELFNNYGEDYWKNRQELKK